MILHEKNLPTEQCKKEKNARVSYPYGDSRRPQSSETASGQRPQETNRNRAAEAGTHLKSRVNAAPGREGFPKSARLRKRPEFLNLSRTGKKVHSPNFIVISTNNERGESRLGITVSSKVGNAVVRNRIKRRLREIFRRRRREWVSASDIVVIARKGAAALSSALIQKEIDYCLREQRSRWK